jgi:hypothetical protein
MGFGALLAVLSAASIVRSHLAVIASIVGFE